MRNAWILRPHQIKSRSARGKLERSELKVLAKGDSWFSTGSFPVCNMLQQMQFSRSACILNLAIPGSAPRPQPCRSASRTGTMNLAFKSGAQRAPRWDAILMSAGGNDLINALPHLIRGGINSHRASDYVDSEALFALEQGLVASYARIVSFRDRESSPNRGVPIFVHSYDYMTPSCAPARFYDLVTITGPWLSPQMRAVPRHLWIPLSNYLIDRVANTLRSLEVTLPNFVVIDTAAHCAASAPRRAAAAVTGKTKFIRRALAIRSSRPRSPAW